MALCACSGDICPSSTPDEVVSGLRLGIVRIKFSLLAIAVSFCDERAAVIRNAEKDLEIIQQKTLEI
jgi:hypothetical protein